jgi:hypothetical protein
MHRSDSCKTVNVSMQKEISSILQVYLANALLSSSLIVQLAILRDDVMA